MTEILFVDDELPILNSLRRVFRGFEDYVYHFANSPMEALEIFAQTSISVIVCDHRMPQMTGAEFLARVKEKRPDAVRIMLTGQADLTAVQLAVNQGEIFRFMLKPWKDDDLRSAVKQAVEYSNLVIENRRLLKLSQNQNDELTKANSHLEEQVQLRTQQLADALFTARSLNVQLSESLFSSTKSLFNLLLLARPELGSHSRRVADHCLGIGREFNLKEEELKELEIAALLHDSGKLSLPNFIVDKNVADYRSEEFELYKTHPAVGAEYLKGIAEYEPLSQYILSHHERYNGTGFPRALSGTHIPLQSFIIGIADEYDHIMSRSRYNQEFNYQYAGQKFSECADREFPGKLVQIMLDYLAKANNRGEGESELRIGLSELMANTVLTRNVYTMSGSLLAAAGITLSAQSIARIRAIARLDPIAGEIHIAKKQRSSATAVSR